MTRKPLIAFFSHKISEFVSIDIMTEYFTRLITIYLSRIVNSASCDITRAETDTLAHAA